MLYRPDVCNCTMPYVSRTVPAYAVQDPAYTAEVFALILVWIDVIMSSVIYRNDPTHTITNVQMSEFLILKY